MNSSKVLLGCVLASMAALVARVTNGETIPDGGSLDLTDTLAASGEIVCSGSATINLKMTQKTDGRYDVRCAFVATNGTLTVDFGTCTDADVLFSAKFRADRNGAVVLRGATRPVLFGSRALTSGGNVWSIPCFGVKSLAFAAGTPADVGIAFTNQIMLAEAVPTDVNCTVTTGSELWLKAQNALPDVLLSHGSEVSLSAFDIVLTATDVLPNATRYVVGDGRNLGVRWVGLSEAWTPVSGAGGSFDPDVELVAESSRLTLWTGCEVRGALCGRGSLRIVEGTGTLRGTYSTTGAILLTESGTVTLDFGGVCDGVCPDIMMTGQKLVYLRAVNVGCVTGTGFDSVVKATSDLSTIASVGGKVSFARSNTSLVTRKMTILDAEAGATIRIDDPAVIAVDETSVPHARLTVRDEGVATDYHVFGADNHGADIPQTWTDDATFDVWVGKGSSFVLSNVLGSAVDVAQAGGSFTLAQKSFDFNATALFHLDASAAGTLVAVTNAEGITVEKSAGSPYIQEWFDVRSSQRTLRGLNYRCWTSGSGTSYTKDVPFNNVVVTQPYLRPNALAGNPILDFADNSRRFNFFDGTTRGFRPKFCVMVFGSESGGGKALLAAEDGALKRGDGTSRGEFKSTDPITVNANVRTWLNGSSVDPTKTGLSGEWDVVSLDTSGMWIYGLSVGSENVSDAPGNGRYAEIVFFDRVLDDFERTTVERALAKKWGLIDKYAAAAEPVASVDVSGHGALALSGKVELKGAFVGTVDLAGADVTYSGTAVPSREDISKIPGRQLWIDPDDTSTLRFSPLACRATEVLGVRDVENDDGRGLICNGEGNPPNNTGIRAAWCNRTARGLGFERNWLDFSNVNLLPNGEKETWGNYYKITPTGKEGDAKPIAVRSAFVISDSLRGGGTPLLDTVTGSKVKPRGIRATDPTTPIWPEGTDGAITDGKTYLNGMSVDGTAHGFTGGAELFAFSTVEDLDIGFLGYFYTTENTFDPAYGEMIGESIFFDRVLTDSERADVEKYLMLKWLNVAPQGVTHFVDATFTGSGVLSGTSQRTLPHFAASYQGAISLGDSLVFRLGDAAGAVTDALVAPGATVVFSTGSVRVNLELEAANGRAKAGEYVLAEVSSFGETSFTLGTVTANGVPVSAEGWEIEAKNGRLTLSVPKKGLVLLLR